MKIIEDTFTVAEKELKLEMRFKIRFFTSSMAEPLIRIAPFLLIYLGFFAAGAKSFGSVTEINFVVFLVLGMLTDVFFVHGYSWLHTKFMQEKYWQTIEAILLAPISKISLLGGQALSIIVALVPSMAIFLLISYLIIPAYFVHIAVVLLCLVLVLPIALSIGLVYSGAALFNENFTPLFNYARVGIVFISCFYYPITIFDKVPMLAALKPLVLFNPFYQAVFAIRQAWIFGIIEWGAIAYVAVFAIATPLLAVFIFNSLWKRLDIQGY